MCHALLDHNCLNIVVLAKFRTKKNRKSISSWRGLRSLKTISPVSDFFATWWIKKNQFDFKLLPLAPYLRSPILAKSRTSFPLPVQAAVVTRHFGETSEPVQDRKDWLLAGFWLFKRFSSFLPSPFLSFFEDICCAWILFLFLEFFFFFDFFEGFVAGVVVKVAEFPKRPIEPNFPRFFEFLAFFELRRVRERSFILASCRRVLKIKF